MHDDPLAALPPAVTKEQVSGWGHGEIAYLTGCINHINEMLASQGTSTITEAALKKATGKDRLDAKVKRALVEHYRKAGWSVDVEEASSGTKFRFS